MTDVEFPSRLVRQEDQRPMVFALELANAGSSNVILLASRIQ